MKLKCGNTSAEISRASSNKLEMEKYEKQRKYREKQREINKTNAAIVTYVKERAPWLIREFFEKRHGKSNIDKVHSPFVN